MDIIKNKKCMNCNIYNYYLQKCEKCNTSICIECHNDFLLNNIICDSCKNNSYSKNLKYICVVCIQKNTYIHTKVFCCNKINICICYYINKNKLATQFRTIKKCPKCNNFFNCSHFCINKYKNDDTICKKCS